MKVLQINSVCGFGSTGSIVVDLYNILEVHHNECIIAYGRKDAPTNISTIKIGSKLDNYLGVLTTRITDRHGFSSKAATIKLIDQIEKYNPDVIHLHNIHGYYINISVLFNYLKAANKPVIWTLHDCWAFTGHCSYFDYIGCDKWKSGCNYCRQKREYPASLIDNSDVNYRIKKELFTSVRNMLIVTPSEWRLRLVKESFLGKYDVKCIYNGIDLNVFKPTDSDFREKYNLQNKIILLGVASIWEERKGLKYLLQLSKVLDPSFKIVIIGADDGKQLPENVIKISGTNSKQELAQIYSAADILINPTLEETLGLINIEALACGTPVITFDTGGSPECIDNTCGIVVPKGNLNALKEAVEHLSKNSIDMKYCINRARLFDKDRTYQSYIDVYKEYSSVGKR